MSAPANQNVQGSATLAYDSQNKIVITDNLKPSDGKTAHQQLIDKTGTNGTKVDTVTDMYHYNGGCFKSDSSVQLKSEPLNPQTGYGKCGLFDDYIAFDAINEGKVVTPVECNAMSEYDRAVQWSYFYF